MSYNIIFRVISALLLLISFENKAQTNEKEVNSKLIEAIISPSNAQEIREVTTELKPGVNIIKIKQLSPFLDVKSIQIKSDNDLVIQSIKFQLGNIRELKQTDSLKLLRDKIAEIQKKIKEETTFLNVIQERKVFLHSNYNISKNDNLKPETFKALNDIISANIKTLAFEYLERTTKISLLTHESEGYKRQIYELSKRSSKTTGEIIVKIVSKKEYQTKFTLSYITEKAGWTPSYDIKVDKLNKPLLINYKANVFQNTGNDWTNIKLKFINTSPSEFGNIPELETYFLPAKNRNVPNSTEITQLGSILIRGTVVAEEKSDGIAKGDPLVGVTLSIKGTTRGTVTDIDGNFSLANVPIGSKIVVSYIGFEPKEFDVYELDYYFIQLKLDTKQLEEVVAVGYGVSSYNSGFTTDGALFENKKKSDGASGTVNIRGLSSVDGRSSGVTVTRTGEQNSNEYSGGMLDFKKAVKPQIKVSSINASNGTSQNFIEFVVDKQTSIASSENTENIDLQKYEIPVEYSYQIIPKKEQSAYLKAQILDWGKLNLLNGDANIYLENTFMGKVTLDVNNFSDTLTISLGKDRNVISKREKLKDFSKSTFFGNTKSNSLHYKISIRNNKQEEISVKVIDQFPISNDSEIEIDKLDSFGGEQNKENGKVEWNIKIPAQNSKELNIKYTVKAPKFRNIFVD